MTTTTRINTASLRLASLWLGLLGFAGCDGDVTDESDVETRSLEDGIACPAGRQLVRMNTPLNTAHACPDVLGWTDQSLFGTTLGELGKYCVYRWNGTMPPSSIALDGLETKLALEGVPDFDRSADCEGMLEQSQDPLTAALGSTVADNFLGAVGALESTDLNVAEPNAVIMVAVVDTSPTSMLAPATPRSPHGEAMVDIVESLACPDPDDCTVEVGRVLGLPRIANNQVDTENGGYAGSHMDLARAIVFAAEQTTGPLIINLSVGWEPWIFGNEIESVGARAVLAAIEHASCDGALIVAAAGNDGGQGTWGPLLPGGWEYRPAPSEARCTNDFGIDEPVLHTNGNYRPLVYSVGGLRYEDSPMTGSREQGLPRLVATATHGTVGTEWPTMTGTSIATAAVSGAAALIWSHFPHLDATQVMDLLYSSGHDLDAPADYSLLGSGNFDMHRLDICAAFESACGPNCPHTGLTCTPNDPIANQDILELILAGLSATDATPNGFTELTSCAPNTTVHTTNSNLLGCPAAFDPARVYTHPQPTQPACPNCTIKKGSGIVSAALDPAYVGSDVEDVNVEIFDGTYTTLYRLGPIQLSTTSITEIRLSTVPTTIRSATISIEFDQLDGISNPRAVSNQLIVLD